MTTYPTHSEVPRERESDIEALARETRTPVELVHEIYRTEHAKLDETAKIKTFVPVLLRRRVKELLQSQGSRLNN
ncbi:MAG: DUF3562 domain-containing protein [Steroidobacteraceae bacterium]